MIEIYYVNGVETPQEQIIVKKIFTNADRIRAMSDEELAKYIIVMAKDDYCDRHNCTGRPCWQCRLEWLKKEVEDEDNN